MFESVKVSIKNIRCKLSCCSKVPESNEPSRQVSKNSDDIIAEKIPIKKPSK